jgi:putative ABC transport system permease protein
MLKNYLRIAFRNLFKNKVYSFINIIGLAIGLAISLFIIIYVFHETAYDTFHSQSKHIYRIAQTTSSTDREEEQATTPFMLGPVVQQEFPNRVEHAVRFYDLQEENHTFLNREDNISFREYNFYFVDSTFFNVFSAKLIQGNPDQVLKNPLSLVITENLAEKYFGNENPIGQNLSYRGINDMVVTGVMKNWPRQSHMKIDLIASFSSLNSIYASSPDYDQSWLWNPVWTYVLLKKDTDTHMFEEQLSPLIDTYYYAYSGWPADEKLTLEVQPVTEIYLHSNRDQEMNPNSSATYIHILLMVAAFILLIACINFMNLSTARSMERSREVGMRKVMGGHKKQLFFQFIGESILISTIAIIVGLVFVKAALPFFNDLIGKELSFGFFKNVYILPGLLLLTIFVGFISGSYPALFLASFKPSDVLKGTSQKSSSRILFRKILVTFQFALSVVLIIGTLIIYFQLQYIQDKDLGFDEKNVVLLPTKQNLIAWEFESFKERALTHAQIESVTGLGKIPGTETQEYYRYVPASVNQDQDITNLALHVTYDFENTFDINMLAGRAFSRDFPSDPENAVIINETMLSQLDAESPSEAIGETIYFYPLEQDRQSFSIIGVTEDFNYSSLKKKIDPVVIRLSAGTNPILRTIEHTAVEIAPGDPTSALSHLETTWNEINHVDPFQYRFLEERLAKIYQNETTMSSIATAFSILCIGIACLGLLGLASYSAQLRQKEIGIRKSLGASVANIIALLSKDFLKLVALGNLVAWPVIYYFGTSWLQNFPYRFELMAYLPFIFLGTAAFIITIALLTVSYHSVKAALLNPVEAIRNE